MEQVLVNILENAARYTPAGTHIWIHAKFDVATVVIQIENDGPSLGGAEHEAMFEKFGRGDNAGAHGAGLGLAICRAILEAHSGTITAKPRQPRGVTFTITLPNTMPAPEVPLA